MEEFDISGMYAGYLVGSTPLGFICISFIVWLWTNTSYMGPMISNILLLLAGNIIYFLSATFNLSWFLFLGRFMVGLGGTSYLNRRYISDYASISYRTKVSLLFVAFNTTGTALGPLIGGFCTLIDEHEVFGI